MVTAVVVTLERIEQRRGESLEQLKRDVVLEFSGEWICVEFVNELGEVVELWDSQAR